MTWVCHGIFQMMVTPSIIERMYAVQRTNIARDFAKSKIQQENSRDFLPQMLFYSYCDKLTIS